jgi:hypothetical protein
VRVTEKPNASGAQFVVDVWIVNDFACEIDCPVGKTRARLIGVIDRPIDPVTKAELLGQMYCQSTQGSPKTTTGHLVDDRAGIVVSEGRGYDLLEIKAFPEDNGWQENHISAVTQAVRVAD